MNPILFLFKSSSLVARTVAQLAVVGTVGAMSVGVMSSSAFTSLNAVASNPGANAFSATSGTLSLTPTDIANGFAFSNATPVAITGMAPGDTVNRLVDFHNSGTLDGTGLTLSITDGQNSPTNTNLTNDATRGLHVWVQSCTNIWTQAAGNAVAVCSGSGTTADVLGTLASPVALSLLKTTPQALIPSTLAAGAHMYLKFSVTLPAQTETSTNGAAGVPVVGTGTIQGLAALVTWTITEVQSATATTTNS